MRKVLKFVTGKKDDRHEGLTPSSSGEILSPAQTPETERFLGIDSTSGYIVDFCGKDKSLTKLHKAAWQGNLEKLKTALKKVDVDAVDRHNRTALHLAVSRGHANIAWHLLGSNAKHTICDGEGCTPLLKAIDCGQKECIALLLERGASVNHADFCGNTGLHKTIKKAALDIVSTLLQKGADCDIANNAGEYPIHVAMKSGNRDLLQILLRSGASVNVFDRENRTPLMLAAKSGNLELTQLIIEHGAQLNIMDSNGWTAEDYALFGEHQEVARNLKALIKGTKHQTTEEKENSVARNDSQSSSDLTEKVAKPVPIEETEIDSPEASVVPPPCQPPRSWEMIQAGMIDETDGEVKRRSITVLGSLHSRRESFNGSHLIDAINTTAAAAATATATKYTLSLHRRKDAKIKDIRQRFSLNEEESMKWEDFSDKKKDSVKKRASSESSDWDSDLSSLLNSARVPEQPKIPVVLSTTDNKENNNEEGGTLGRIDTLQGSEEIWVVNAQISSESVEETFPPPPTAFELGVDMAKSISYIKGLSIDHPFESCAQEEMSFESRLSKVEEKDVPQQSKRHARQASISSCKWRSEELPQQSRPVDRLIDVNRRINEQLECYDQALRELAESPYGKKEEIIISTLTEKVPPASNYYSLPASRFKQQKTKPAAAVSVNDRGSLPSIVSERENNQALGYDVKLDSLPLPPVSPLSANRDNMESSLSDEAAGSIRGSKRHILLAMRDTPHDVQATNTSLEDQILSPLTKEAFDLDANLNESCFEANLERQETVIERPTRPKSTSSDDSREEPTLWLQEVKDEIKTLEEREFSPLGAVYEEIKAEEIAKEQEHDEHQQSISSSESDLLLSASGGKKQTDEEMMAFRDDSPDVSYSSGPVEPLQSQKYSGSETDTSQSDVTPTKQISIKKWLKERLMKENAEKKQLEELAAKLAEKAERLQYELADAREATKNRDEFIAILQGQLARIEAAYTNSLEESIHCRLQLNSLEQEVGHLKKLCLQYENERNPEKENKENMVEIEQRTKSDNDWRQQQEDESSERSSETESIKINDNEKSCQIINNYGANNMGLELRNLQLLEKLKEMNDRNAELEKTVQSLKNTQHSHLKINESILELRRKNEEMEGELKTVKEQLEKTENYRIENETLSLELERLRESVNLKKQTSGLITSNASNNKLPIVVSNDIDAEIVELREELERIKKEETTERKGSTNTRRKETGKPNELAWSSLYGIKTVPRKSEKEEDSEELIEFKVRELEIELEKMREELLRQRTESRFKLKVEAAKKSLEENLDLFEMSLICQAREQKIAEMNLELKEKHRLEIEVDHLKTQLQRDFVPKTDLEMMKLQHNLNAQRSSKGAVEKSWEEDDAELKRRADVLAKERTKAMELKRKYAAKTEWTAELMSFPERTTKQQGSANVPIKFGEQLKAALEAAMHISTNDFDEDNEDGADLSASRNMELLKQKYLS